MKAFLLLCLLHSAFGQKFKNPWDGLLEEEDSYPVGDCARDQGSCGCCKIYKEVYWMERYFKEKLDQLDAEYYKVHDKFKYIKASQTAFSAALFKDGSLKCFGKKEVNESLIYKYVHLNLGYGYNVSTGIFTAPHSGVYVFAITVYSDTGSAANKEAACAGLQVNNEDMVGASDQNINDHEDSSSNAVAIKLKAGDQVHVNLPGGCLICDEKYHYNTFSGFLLYLSE